MAYKEIESVPKGAVKLGQIMVTEKREIDAYLRGGPLGAMGHVINNAARAFFQAHPEYRGKTVGTIPETHPFYLKPPEAELFIGFYELPKNRMQDI